MCCQGSDEKYGDRYDHFSSLLAKISMSNRNGTDTEGNRKPLAFTDETLPVISCKEIVHKDPV